MTLNVTISDLATVRLETLARDGETASETVERLVMEVWDALPSAPLSARERYKLQTGRWPEERG